MKKYIMAAIISMVFVSSVNAQQNTISVGGTIIEPVGSVINFTFSSNRPSRVYTTVTHNFNVTAQNNNITANRSFNVTNTFMVQPNFTIQNDYSFGSFLFR
jgi:hypothetical protein